MPPKEWYETGGFPPVGWVPAKCWNDREGNMWVRYWLHGRVITKMVFKYCGRDKRGQKILIHVG